MVTKFAIYPTGATDLKSVPAVFSYRSTPALPDLILDPDILHIPRLLLWGNRDAVIVVLHTDCLYSTQRIMYHVSFAYRFVAALEEYGQNSHGK